MELRDQGGTTRASPPGILGKLFPPSPSGPHLECRTGMEHLLRMLPMMMASLSVQVPDSHSGMRIPGDGDSQAPTTSIPRHNPGGLSPFSLTPGSRGSAGEG